VGGVLLFAGASVFDDPGECEVGVFGSLGESSGEIVEATGEPRIVMAEAIHAESD
jgi:hypothetical protein